MKRVLLVDDDEVFRDRLARSLSRRGFEVAGAANAMQARELCQGFFPDYAVVDLKMPEESGLVVVRDIKAVCPKSRVVVLTGYGSIATALEAVRSGAADYLTKPVDADEIIRAFEGGSQEAEVSVPSLDRVEWEHLQRVLSDCGNNISKAARLLGIDRRSLQRKLAKYPPQR